LSSLGDCCDDLSESEKIILELKTKLEASEKSNLELTEKLLNTENEKREMEAQLNSSHNTIDEMSVKIYNLETMNEELTNELVLWKVKNLNVDVKFSSYVIHKRINSNRQFNYI
jgi:septal ring factor EnvC (AmiA/AmiB activator)